MSESSKIRLDSNGYFWLSGLNSKTKALYENAFKNGEVKNMIRDIRNASRRFGIELKETGNGTGEGVFCRKGMSSDETFGFYCGEYRPRDSSSGTASDEDNEDYVIYVEARGRKYPKGLEIDGFHSANVAFNAAKINHSCTRFNARLEISDVDGVSMLLAQSIRDIQPGEEILINYGGESGIEGYWLPFSTLEKKHRPVPVGMKIQRCLCNHPNGCPYDFARLMRSSKNTRKQAVFRAPMPIPESTVSVTESQREDVLESVCVPDDRHSGRRRKRENVKTANQKSSQAVPVQQPAKKRILEYSVGCGITDSTANTSTIPASLEKSSIDQHTAAKESMHFSVHVQRDPPSAPSESTPTQQLSIHPNVESSQTSTYSTAVSQDAVRIPHSTLAPPMPHTGDRFVIEVQPHFQLAQIPTLSANNSPQYVHTPRLIGFQISGQPNVGGQPTFGGQPVRPAFGGQPVQPTFGGQVVWPTFGGQPVRPSFGRQPMRPTEVWQPVQPTFSGHTVHPIFSNPPLLPGLSVQQVFSGQPLFSRQQVSSEQLFFLGQQVPSRQPVSSMQTGSSSDSRLEKGTTLDEIKSDQSTTKKPRHTTMTEKIQGRLRELAGDFKAIEIEFISQYPDITLPWTKKSAHYEEFCYKGSNSKILWMHIVAQIHKKTVLGEIGSSGFGGISSFEIPFETLDEFNKAGFRPTLQIQEDMNKKRTEINETASTALKNEYQRMKRVWGNMGFSEIKDVSSYRFTFDEKVQRKFQSLNMKRKTKRKANQEGSRDEG